MSQNVSENRTRDFVTVYNDVVRYPNLSAVAEKLGITRKTVVNSAAIIRRNKNNQLIDRSGPQNRPRQIGEELREIETNLPQVEEDLNTLLARAMTHNERVIHHNEVAQLLDINIKVDGPFGVVGLGDPHLNSTGCDLRKAFSDAELVADHPALFGVAIGDYLDNFIFGKLERERRKDIMSHDDANRIQEHYLSIIAPKLIAAISANHDQWVVQLGGVDPLKSLMKEWGLEDIFGDEIRVRLNTPSGHSFVHLARHNCPGRSKVHPIHGVATHILEKWTGEDVIWAGHIHVASHVSTQKEWMGEARVVHGVQLPSYKAVDQYSTVKGFRKAVPFTTPIILHIPSEKRSIFFENVSDGIKHLNLLRS